MNQEEWYDCVMIRLHLSPWDHETRAQIEEFWYAGFSVLDTCEAFEERWKKSYIAWAHRCLPPS